MTRILALLLLVLLTACTGSHTSAPAPAPPPSGPSAADLRIAGAPGFWEQTMPAGLDPYNNTLTMSAENHSLAGPYTTLKFDSPGMTGAFVDNVRLTLRDSPHWRDKFNTLGFAELHFTGNGYDLYLDPLH